MARARTWACMRCDEHRYSAWFLTGRDTAPLLVAGDFLGGLPTADEAPPLLPALICCAHDFSRQVEVRAQAIDLMASAVTVRPSAVAFHASQRVDDPHHALAITGIVSSVSVHPLCVRHAVGAPSGATP